MAIQPHEIDEAIGCKKRSAKEIAESIAKSKQFLNVVTEAVNSSSELPPGVMGASFAQQVRVAIANELLNQS